MDTKHPTAEFVDLLCDRIMNSQVLFFFAAGASSNWDYPRADSLTKLLFNRVVELWSTDEEFRTLLAEKATEDILLRVGVNASKSVATVEARGSESGSDPVKQAAAEAGALLVEHLRQQHRFDGDLARLKECIDAECKKSLPGLGDFTDGLNLEKSYFLDRLWVDLQQEDRPVWPEWDNDINGDPVSLGRIGIPYLVIGRLAKEGLIREVVTINYDHLLELGCWAVGMVRAYPPGRAEHLQPSQIQSVARESAIAGWAEAFRVIADRKEQTLTYPDRLAFRVIKLHGCLDTARERVEDLRNCGSDEQKPDLSQGALNQVITRKELLTWRQDSWARDLFVDRVRSHHMVFAGFSGADPVLHATLRDTFTEALDTDHQASQIEYSGPSEVRAQAIDVQNLPANASLTQLLRAACTSNLPPAPRQLLELDRPRAKAELEDLFRTLYAEVMHRWIDAQIESLGQGILTDWMPGTTPRDRNDESQKLMHWLDRLRGEPGLHTDFFFNAIPGALRWSWMGRAPQVVRPGGFEANRYGRPHYYVPFHHNLSWALTLANAYRVVAEKGGGHIQFEEDGWMEWKADLATRWGALRILPLVMPQPANLIRLAAFRHLTTGNQAARHRQPAARTIFLTITPGAKRTPDLELPWNEVSAGMGTIRAKVFSVRMTDLWREKQRASLLAQLKRFAGEA